MLPINSHHPSSSGNLKEIPSIMTFQELVGRWKPFHYLKLERGTQQTYDRRLPHFHFLNDLQVEEITVGTIDNLVSHWVKNCSKNKRRFTFEKELHILKVILNYY